MRNLLAFLFPLVVALLLIWIIPEQQRVHVASQKLQRMNINSVVALESVLNQYNYAWPPQPGKSVPALEVLNLPGDLSSIRNVKKKKSLFFRIMLPIVLAENDRISAVRERMIKLLDRGVVRLDKTERRWLEVVAKQFKVKGDLAASATQNKLRRRVDAVPPSLVLAQSANESAWGTSRFARQGNNLFGQWSYRQADGMVPLDRSAGKTHVVRSFANISASVRAYMLNINTNPAYRKLRILRQQMRDSNAELDGHALATGLTRYSARGEDYVLELQRIMRSNRLPARLASVQLQ